MQKAHDEDPGLADHAGGWLTHVDEDGNEKRLGRRGRVEDFPRRAVLLHHEVGGLQTAELSRGLGDRRHEGGFLLLRGRGGQGSGQGYRDQERCNGTKAHTVTPRDTPEQGGIGRIDRQSIAAARGPKAGKTRSNGVIEG
jgi:hypothetical protein